MTQAVPMRRVMNGKGALIISLVLGAVAAGLIVAFLASRGGDEASLPIAAPVSVIVASQDIPAGTTITSGMLAEKRVPQELLVAGTFTDLKDVAGEVARYPISKGEQVGAAKLVQAAQVKALSFQIPEGLRGFTIKLDPDTTPAELIAPGDFVDVIASAELQRISITSQVQTLPDDKQPAAAVTLIQNVQVLSVNRDYADNGVVYDSATRGQPIKEEDDASSITLAVTPDQAQLLWLATQKGKLTIVLRGFGDDKVTELNPIAEPIRLK